MLFTFLSHFLSFSEKKCIIRQTEFIQKMISSQGILDLCGRHGRNLVSLTPDVYYLEYHHLHHHLHRPHHRHHHTILTSTSIIIAMMSRLRELGPHVGECQMPPNHSTNTDNTCASFINLFLLATFCSSQPSMVQWLSSSIFPFCLVGRSVVVPPW